MKKTNGKFFEVTESRKNDIVLSALKCFCEKGYDGTTVDDITKKCNCSHGLFYHYFKSKKEVFDTVISERKREKSDEIEDKLSKIESSKDKLRFLIENIYSELKDDENFAYHFYFFIMQCFNFKIKGKAPEKKEIPNPVKKLEDLFTEGQKKGEFTDKYTPRECTEIFLSLIQGTTLAFTLAPKEIQNNMRLPNIDFIIDIYLKRKEIQ